MACPKDHRIAECLARDEKERVFHRKDNLKQHFRNFHGSTLDDCVARAWEVRTEHAIRSWPCGFCGIVLKDWNDRQVHTAGHFRKGATMETWDQDLACRQVPSVHQDESRENILPSTAIDEHETEEIIHGELQVGGKFLAKDGYHDHAICFQCLLADLNPFGHLNAFEPHRPSRICFINRPAWLWHCDEQSSLIVLVERPETHSSRSVWVRYKTYSFLRVLVPEWSHPFETDSSQTIVIEFGSGTQPMVSHTNSSRWETVEQSYRNIDPALLSAIMSSKIQVKFFKSWQYLDFVTLFSKSAPLLVNHVNVENHMDVWIEVQHCDVCPLSFQSLNDARGHQLYHEGAYVDIFGRRLSRLMNNVFTPFLRLDEKRPGHFSLGTLIRIVEFKCGSLLPAHGSSWGCKKLFIGISSFRDHLKSAIGQICWARLPQYSPSAILGRRLSLNEELILNLARPYSQITGLPEVLYVLYPALLRTDESFTLGANTTILQKSHGSEIGMIEKKSLSTIASASTFSTARSSSSIISSNSALSSGRIRRTPTFMINKFLDNMTEADAEDKCYVANSTLQP